MNRIARRLGLGSRTKPANRRRTRALVLPIVVFVLAGALLIADIHASRLALSQAGVPARGECNVGFRPATVPLVRNGNFATAPNHVRSAGHPGDTIVEPGHEYRNADFYSQMYNYGTDVYPSQEVATFNSFSIQSGSFQRYVFNDLDQVPFPGDPAFGVPASNNWFYSNGNMLDGTEYLVWGQQITGLTVGNEYVFVTYISNVVEPPDSAFAKPTIRLRRGGSVDRPDGTVILPATQVLEAGTGNSDPLNGWRRIAVRFTASSSTEILKVTNSAPNIYGDDFGMTAVMVQQCVPVAPTPTPTPTPTPVPARSFSCNALTADPQTPLYAGQPVTVTVRYRQIVGVGAPNPTDYRLGLTQSYTPAGLPPGGQIATPTLVSSGGLHYLSATFTTTAPDAATTGVVSISSQLQVLSGGAVVNDTCTGTLIAARRPYFEVRQSDVWAGATFADSVLGCSASAEPDAQIRTFARLQTNGQWRGSSAAFGATATGAVDGSAVQNAGNNYGNAQAFISAARNGVAGVNAANESTFRNKRVPNDPNYLGGDFDEGGALMHCLPDFYQETRLATVTTIGSTVDPSDLATGNQYEVLSDAVLSAGTYAVRSTLYVDGDLYISGNVTYGNYSIANTDDPNAVPYLSLVVRGNIYIASNVTRIDGFLIAQPRAGQEASTGRVVTCARLNGGSAEAMPLADIPSNCAASLTIRGAIVSRSIQFLRAGGDAGRDFGQPTQPSEVIEGTGAMYSGRPLFRSKLSGVSTSGESYESITTLPPIY